MKVETSINSGNDIDPHRNFNFKLSGRWRPAGSALGDPPRAVPLAR